MRYFEPGKSSDHKFQIDRKSFFTRSAFILSCIFILWLITAIIAFPLNKEVLSNNQGAKGEYASQLEMIASDIKVFLFSLRNLNLIFLFISSGFFAKLLYGGAINGMAGNNSKNPLVKKSILREGVFGVIPKIDLSDHLTPEINSNKLPLNGPLKLITNDKIIILAQDAEGYLLFNPSSEKNIFQLEITRGTKISSIFESSIEIKADKIEFFSTDGEILSLSDALLQISPKLEFAEGDSGSWKRISKRSAQDLAAWLESKSFLIEFFKEHIQQKLGKFSTHQLLSGNMSSSEQSDEFVKEGNSKERINWLSKSHRQYMEVNPVKEKPTSIRKRPRINRLKKSKIQTSNLDTPNNNLVNFNPIFEDFLSTLNSFSHLLKFDLNNFEVGSLEKN